MPSGAFSTLGGSARSVCPQPDHPVAGAEYRNNNNNIWERMARVLVSDDDDGDSSSTSRMNEFVQYVTVLRVGVPSFLGAAFAKLVYPDVAMMVANSLLHDDSGVFAVVAQDASQYIQNILTTSGLVFSLLVGQTYYFMVRPGVQ